MVITYYGISCFKIQSGDTVLALDPFTKESGLTPPRFEAHAAISSAPHPNYSSETTLQILGPGEYEFKGIYIKGTRVSAHNTVYAITWEGMRLVHMGDYKETSLRPDIQEAIGTPDILFVPVGGKNVIDEEQAAKLISQIEPRIVIPMHYKSPDAFLKEMGEKIKPEDKFTIKKKDLPSAEETQVVVLKTP